MAHPGDGGDRRPELRIGDRERDATLAHLTQAQHAGRLTLAEFDERSSALLAARTQSDLDALTGDLPAPVRVGPTPEQRKASKQATQALRIALSVWLFVSVLCVAIWLATTIGSDGGTYFWPIWPMIGTSIPVLIAMITKFNNSRD